MDDLAAEGEDVHDPAGVGPNPSLLVVPRDDRSPARPGNQFPLEETKLREHALDARQGSIDEVALEAVGLAHLHGNRRHARSGRFCA